jgi:hypothetical protein
MSGKKQQPKKDHEEGEDDVPGKKVKLNSGDPKHLAHEDEDEFGSQDVQDNEVDEDIESDGTSPTPRSPA